MESKMDIGTWVNVDKCIQVREPLVSSDGPKNCVLCLKIGDTCTKSNSQSYRKD